MAGYTFGLAVKADAVKDVKVKATMIPCPANGTDGHPTGCGQTADGRWPTTDGQTSWRRPPGEVRDRSRDGAHYWYSPEGLAMHLAVTFAGSDDAIAAEVNKYMASRKDPRKVKATNTTVKGDRRFVAA